MWNRSDAANALRYDDKDWSLITWTLYLMTFLKCNVVSVKSGKMLQLIISIEKAKTLPKFVIPARNASMREASPISLFTWKKRGNVRGRGNGIILKEDWLEIKRTMLFIEKRIDNTLWSIMRLTKKLLGKKV